MKNRAATLFNYAEAVVDGMDLKTLCAFAVDTIVDNLDDYSDKEVIELCKKYDEDNSLGLIE